MDVRRLVIVKDTVYFEGGLSAVEPVTRVAGCAVIANPLAGQATDQLDVFLPWGAELGETLVKECLAALPHAAVAYGKAAIVGTNGDIEHGAALMHPRMGKPMREAIGGGQAIIPSNVKIGAVGTSIDVPLGHKDDVWSFNEIDTLTITIGSAPRPTKFWSSSR